MRRLLVLALVALGLVPAVPAHAEPVAPATVDSLEAAWLSSYETDWSRIGGTRKDKVHIDNGLAQKTRLTVDVRKRTWHERSSAAYVSPVNKVMHSGQVYSRTDSSVRSGLEKHGIRRTPAWTSRTVSRQAFRAGFREARQQAFGRIHPRDMQWSELTSSTDPEGLTTWTGTRIEVVSTSNGNQDVLTAQVRAVADAQHRLVFWRTSEKTTGLPGTPGHTRLEVNTWDWDPAPIRVPRADNRLRPLVVAGTRLLNKAFAVAKLVDDNEWTVAELHEQYAGQPGVRTILEGLVLYRTVRGQRIAWKVVLDGGRASVYVAR